MEKFDGMNEQEAFEYLEALQREVREAPTDKIISLQQDLRELRDYIDGSQRTWAVSTNKQNNRNESRQYIPGKGFTSVEGGNPGLVNDIEKRQKYESRGNDLKKGLSVVYGIDEVQLRSVMVSTDNIVLPKYTSNTLNPTWAGVSGLVDVVNVPPLLGGESYSKGFVTGYGTGDYTDEGADYHDAEPTFDYVTTGKQKITAYAEISNEVSRLPNADYQGEVANAVRIAIRRKMGQQIILGTGTNSITGLYNAPAKCAVQTISIASIGADTLADLIFGHGDNEEVDGGNTLILNKTDLHAFAKVKDATGKNVYKIELDATGNTGRIGAGDSYMIPFVINSSCNALSATATASGANTMIFGKLLGYELPIFSDLTVERSTDYKFKQGMICYRGEIYVGGTPASYKNFTIVTKA